jgi:signal recognition particle subunit SEC65
MAARQRGELPKGLAQGRSQFLAWRASRKRGRRIPQTLWTLAVRLVKTHGLSRTATALGLDYYRLRKQVAKTADQPQSSSHAFVELSSPVVVGKQGVFELDNGAGARMRVQLMGYDAADVVALLRNFWSAE